MNIFKLLIGNRASYEIDSTLYLFLVGLILGAVIFFSLNTIWMVVLYIFFLTSIILHDFIQIRFASTFDMTIRKYVLFPFGSKKLFGEDFSKPIHEFFYGLSGILVYFALILIAFGLGQLFPSLWPQELFLKNTITEQTFDAILISYPLFSIFWINFLLLMFNTFIFAIPMDGGRIVKSIITIFFGKDYALRILPFISKIVSFIIVIIGIIFWDIIIIILGVFVYVMSLREISSSEIVNALSNKRVDDFISHTELIFNSSDKLDQCFEKMREEMIPEAIIKFTNKKFGVLKVEKISEVAKAYWPSKEVGDIVEEVEPAKESEKLSFIAQYMVDKNLPILPVVHHKTGVLIGIIKRSDLVDFLKIHKIYS